MFIGRQKELEVLDNEFKKNRKSAVLIYGKRRVGKTRLIAEAAKKFDGDTINYMCIQSTFEGNLSLLSRAVSSSLNLPGLNFSSLSDLFGFLKGMNRKILIVLDEYQYLKASRKDKEMDSMMQAIVDELSDNIKLILCGSYISIMKELLEESNPLFGRFSSVLKIEEFDYYEASLFYPERTIREKIMLYSIFGGSPYVLQALDGEKTVEENIKALAIGENSILRIYIEHIMLNEIRKTYDVRVLEALANGKKRYKEIVSYINMSDNGLLDKQLKNLIGMETISKISPINKKNDNKKLFYQIEDNLMRFYFAYIFPNAGIIEKYGSDEFFNIYIKDSLETFVSYRFENIAFQYFIRLAKAGKLTSSRDFGQYWYNDKESKTNGEFDLVVEKSSSYDVYEVKFYKERMTKENADEEAGKIKRIKGIPLGRIGFISSSGFDFEDESYILISGEDIY